MKLMIALSLTAAVTASTEPQLRRPVAPQLHRALQEIEYIGNNGSPADGFPLGLCQGDCDDDSECGDGLVCYQRVGTEEVPGCTIGSDSAATLDFCIEPAQMSDEQKVEQASMIGNMVSITVTNQAYQQPFGGIFVMTHNAEEVPLFTVGMEASEPLAILAEDGNPSLLVEAYNNSANAGYVGAMAEGAPYFGGQSVEFLVPFDMNYPYLTIATMAINSNDCFVALNAVKLEPKAVLQAPGYDAGSEENNELCESIPGPACADTPGNVRSGNGEGFVHVHRGFFGINAAEGGLTAPGYDWRNPMMRVEMKM